LGILKRSGRDIRERQDVIRFPGTRWGLEMGLISRKNPKEGKETLGHKDERKGEGEKKKGQRRDAIRKQEKEQANGKAEKG